ncbi:DUF1772 domain-containing protein [Bacteroidales bacterium AH-315-I05]|nr:DUF1772 domain-containing protein [Bacteroidales bacterium AH-315-I05]
MEINIKSTLLFFAIITTGLSAGLLYAWTVSVIPGLKDIPSKNYLEAMQSINRAILNPGFFIIFFGSLILMILSVYFQYKVQVNLSFWLITAGTIFYLIGTIAVTIFGNVPMNEALDVMNINVLNGEELENIRLSFESKWNQLNTVRTIFAVLAFTLLLLGVFSND